MAYHIRCNTHNDFMPGSFHLPLKSYIGTTRGTLLSCRVGEIALYCIFVHYSEYYIKISLFIIWRSRKQRQIIINRPLLLWLWPDCRISLVGLSRSFLSRPASFGCQILLQQRITTGGAADLWLNGLKLPPSRRRERNTRRNWIRSPPHADGQTDRQTDTSKQMAKGARMWNARPPTFLWPSQRKKEEEEKEDFSTFSRSFFSPLLIRESTVYFILFSRRESKFG